MSELLDPNLKTLFRPQLARFQPRGPDKTQKPIEI
jgi:hypothetical protein